MPCFVHGVALLHFAHTAIAALASDPDGHVGYEAPQLPESWVEVAAASSDSFLTLRFALHQQNLHKLHRAALSVSDPHSVEYGRYLSGSQVASLTEPHHEDLTVVTEWLLGAGMNFSRAAGSEVVELSATVGAIAPLLQTSFRLVSNIQTGQQLIQAGDYWLPAAIDASVCAIYGLHGLPLPSRQRPGRKRDMAAVTPAVLASTYNISIPSLTAAKNVQAVAEFQGETMKPSDLVTFFKKYAKNLPSTDHVVHKFVGKDPTGDGGIEASLDIEYIMGVAPGVPTEFWYWGGDDFCLDLKLWTGAIISAATAGDVPLVHSVSYGWQGKLSEISCQSMKVHNIDTNFAKLAAMGITILFASGDSGSGYQSPSRRIFPPWKKPVLYPSWPASSPWVTAVGSTRFVHQKIGQPEMATDQFGSGGGFSSQFPAFAAQQSAVQSYLETATGLPPSGSFPSSGRATPDVAALGEGFKVIADGSVEDVGGTSASTPTFAAIVSLLNRARLDAGKPAMGYLNPWLYQNPDAFTDVVIGTNKIGRDGEKLKYGYDCAEGWDPVTGLGTPIFDRMLAAALKAPEEMPPSSIVV